MKEIYFDNASTALPVYPHDSEGCFGNPSTTHELGVKAYDAINQAKKDLCNILGCEKDELVLTSGGTESNNLAIIGYALAHKRNNTKFAAFSWAHPSVTQAINQAAQLGYGQEIKLSQKFSSSSFAEDSNFISIPHICHETGDRYNIEEISQNLKLLNPKNIIHIDGVQGFCKEKINLRNIDLYSFSGHKIHAQSGTGGLFVKKGVRVSALLHGGGQEMGLRAGTQNTQGIVSLSRTAKAIYENMESNLKKTSAVKAEMLKLVDELRCVYVNSSSETSPYILNMSFTGVKGEVLVNMLSQKGIYVSTGAACRVSKKDVPALVLLGYSKERADSAIRFSFSHFNTACEAKLARNAIIECVISLRKIRR